MSEVARVDFADPGKKAKPRGVDIELGKTLLEAAHGAGVEMEATCGARGRCRSCRIKIVKGEVTPPTVQDTIQLGHEAVQEHFRLACQTKAVGDCSVMAMPPKSEVGHQILTGKPDTTKHDRLTLDSGIEKVVVQAEAPTDEHHQTSDWDEILNALLRPVSRSASLEVLRKVPEVLRKSGGTVTVTLFGDEVIDLEAGDTAAQAYGVAFDIGTTSVVGTLIDLTSGEQLAEVGGVNPQTVYGGDLMSRIAYAQFDAKKLTTLRARIINALNDFIKEACASAGVSAHHVHKIVIVGNTCMHHIVLGIDVTHVGLAPYAPAAAHPIVVTGRDLPLKGVPNARICFLPIVAGFVGADTMACVLATRIYESEETRAFVDIGTNGEVVMGNKDRLMACSAPAGPALEGAQIRHGMRGAIGAVEKVTVEGDVVCGVIGDVPAIGICGSGLIDACAKLVEAELIEPSGRLRNRERDDFAVPLRKRFRESAEGRDFVLVWAEDAGKGEPITLTQADIRQVQLAKSAIYSGIVMLQRVMEVSDEALAELMLCGGFGNYINTESAVTIKLVPALALEKITYSGNAALIGAQMALISETERHRATELAARIEHVALATHPQFQEVFVEGMVFLKRSDLESAEAKGGKDSERLAASV